MPRTKTVKDVVFLHGFTGSLRDWVVISEWIRPQGFQSQLIDIIGHGGSYPNWGHVEDYQMPTVAKRIKSMTVSRFHLVGYSMGGRLALYFATRYPEAVASLTLESGSPGLNTEAERDARRKADNDLADKIEANGIAWFAEYWGNLSLWNTQSAELKAHLHRNRLKNSAIGLANSLRGMGTGVMPSLWDDLVQLPMPVKLIVGEHDKKFVTINQKIAELIPNVDLTIVPDAGHTVHLEQPDNFKDVLVSFLNQHKTS